jgi:CubicO group peptidase (beta-lactamase class C family)
VSRPLTFLAFCLFICLTSAAWAGAEPVFSLTGPDAEANGKAEGYPVWLQPGLVPQSYMVGTYSHFTEKYPHHIAARSASPSPWRRPEKELTVNYAYADANHDLADYLARHPVTGLLIAHNDTILFEHYQYARTDQDKFLSQSMAKTIVAMLIGIAVQEGAIGSIDQTAADYVPDLAGTEYGKTQIRALLHMASGVAFSETYDGSDDVSRLGKMLASRSNPGPAQAVATFNTREVPPGTRFHFGRRC